MASLIYTVASGDYLKYVPLFKYCAKRAHPGADVRVDECQQVPIAYFASCARFLNDPTDGRYDMVYVTDVDMMLMETKPTLFETHCRYMTGSGLCYSNTPRKNEPMGKDRMTGLHFATKEWYQRTAHYRQDALEGLGKKLFGIGRFDDELMLMKICRDSGVGIPPRRKLISQHFGIHIGTIRAYQHKSGETMRHQLSMRITPEYARQWCAVMEEPGYQILAIDAFKDRTFREQLLTLEAFCRRRAKE